MERKLTEGGFFLLDNIQGSRKTISLWEDVLRLFYVDVIQV